MMRRLTLASLLVLLVALPASARADGLPVIGIAVQNSEIRSTDGAFTYVSHVHRHNTWLLRLDHRGRPVRSVVLPGQLVVPVVAYDGSPSGLSADGRTLVLIRPRIAFPQAHTSLALVDPGTLTIRRHLELHGDYSFDAISPDGRWLYLIQYTSRVDPTSYRVRALDALTGRLLPHDIVDPRDRGEKMAGTPLTRLQGPDGRWAYTLYNGQTPFVHALDTAGRTARCIDVPPLPATADPFQAKLRLLAGDRLLVVAGGQTVATIDTRTLAIRTAHRAPPVRRTARATADSTELLATVGLAFLTLALLTAAYGARRSISHRPAART